MVKELDQDNLQAIVAEENIVLVQFSARMVWQLPHHEAEV